MWTNYHTHTHYCDGKESIEVTVGKAHELGMTAIGFSSHAPLPFEKAWCMKADQLPEYIETINLLKKTSPLPVYTGLEVDFIPGVVSPTDFRHQLDYTIGSVHFVERYTNGEHWEIDSTFTVFKEGLERIFDNNVRTAVERYFELTRKMVDHSNPDIVGHLDKIKMQNRNGLFNETESWYQAAVVSTLNAIKKAGCIVEVNTRGLYQQKTTTTYPSPWILQRIHQMNMPITLSSDAHHPSDLVNQFPETARILLELGFKNLRILLDGKWQDVAFNEHGLQFKQVSHHPVVKPN